MLNKETLAYIPHKQCFPKEEMSVTGGAQGPNRHHGGTITNRMVGLPGHCNMQLPQHIILVIDQWGI